MIRIHLSRLMGERRVKIADLVRETGISRTTLTRIYYEESERIDLDILERLCRYFGVGVPEMLEVVENSGDEE